MPRALRSSVLCLCLASAVASPAPAAPPPSSDSALPVDSLPRAERLARALHHATRYLGPEVAAQVQAIARPEALAPLVTVLVLGVVSQEVPVAGEVVDAVLLGWAACTLGWEGVVAASDFVRFVKGALLARSEADLELEQAGQHFARFVARVGVDVALAVLLHKAARRLQTEIHRIGPEGGGPGGGGPGGQPVPVAAGAGTSGRGAAVPGYRVLADGTIVVLGAMAAGLEHRSV